MRVEVEQLTKAYYEALAKGNSSLVKELEKKLEIFAEYGSAYRSLTENLEFEREQLALLRAKYEETKADATRSLTTKFVVNRAWPAEKKGLSYSLVDRFSKFILRILVDSFWASLRWRISERSNSTSARVLSQADITKWLYWLGDPSWSLLDSLSISNSFGS